MDIHPRLVLSTSLSSVLSPFLVWDSSDIVSSPVVQGVAFLSVQGLGLIKVVIFLPVLAVFVGQGHSIAETGRASTAGDAVARLGT